MVCLCSLAVCAYEISCHQGFFHRFAFDNKVIKRFVKFQIGLPPVLDFPGCLKFVLCCPVYRQDQTWDAKCPGFQGAVKMTICMFYCSYKY